MQTDLRRAMRLAAARPGAWLLLVCTLALGIAALTVALSVADAVLWHPVSFPHADRLVRVRADVEPEALRASPAAGLALRGLFPFEIAGATLDAGRGAEDVTIGQISPGLFNALGVEPAQGRLLASEEFTAGSPAVLASATLGAELRAVAPNRDIWIVRVDGVQKTVVGVMPDGFEFPVGRVALWQPLLPGIAPRTFALGVLKPGLTVNQAASLAGWPGQATLTPFVAPSTATVTAIGAFAGAACLLFLVALANAAGLQLARAVEQRNELAIRLALGAGRGQLVRAVLVDSSVATAAAGLMALGLTAVTLPFIVRAVPYLLAFQTLRPVRLDARALTVAALASLAATGAASAVSIWRLRRVSPPRAAQKAHGASGESPARARRMLAAIAIAVTVPILASAGLLAKSLWRLTDVEPGFQTKGLLQVLVDLPAWRYPSETARRAALEELRETLLSTPEVERVTVASAMPPMLDHGEFRDVVVEDRGDSSGAGSVAYDAVDHDFFETTRIALLVGRPFDGRDVEGSNRVVIVSRSLSEKLWPGVNVLGRRFKSSPTGPWRTVVGVASDITTVGPERARGTLAFYLPSRQVSQGAMTAVILRTRLADESAAMPAVRRSIQNVLPDAPVVDFSPVRVWLTAGLDRERFLTGLVAAIAAAALMLALIGTYAMFRTTVQARTREIGIRMTLGATPGLVLRVVLGESASIAALGFVLGMPFAFVTTRSLSAWLFQLSPTDPIIAGAVAAVVVLAAVCAAYLPARRAAQIDPAVALRDL